MQATLNGNALAPSLRLQFARRNYMVRSEKRRRPSPQQGSGYKPGRPPRRRRPRAGIFYKILTVLLLLILWPIGLIPLWKRKLRWSVLVKVFVSIITLMACILLIGSALTVKTDNPTVTKVQDTVNGFLDSAADSLVEMGVGLGDRVQRSLEALDQLNFIYRQQSLRQMADTIDQGVAIAQSIREDAIKLFGSPDEQPEEPADSQTETEAPADETESPAPDSAEPTEGADEDEDMQESVEPVTTSVPAAEITVVAADDELPVYIPDATPEAETGTAVISGMLSRSGLLDVNALPDPKPTPEPTPEVFSFAVKPAGEATVFFNIGSGKYYHMTNVCGSMKNADTHTFAETAENIHQPCERCTPPAKELLEETYIVWLDENSTAHLSDECAAFEGLWNIVSAAEANEAGYEGCAVCGADRYLKALADGQEIVLEAFISAAAEEEPAADEDAGETASES